jgi:hypothetical protein
MLSIYSKIKETSLPKPRPNSTDAKNKKGCQFKQAPRKEAISTAKGIKIEIKIIPEAFAIMKIDVPMMLLFSLENFSCEMIISFMDKW